MQNQTDIMYLDLSDTLTMVFKKINFEKNVMETSVCFQKSVPVSFLIYSHVLRVLTHLNTVSRTYNDCE